MKKINLIFAFLILTSLWGFTQTIKTFTGKYSDEYISGNATYEYYENESFERVYNGNFKFTQGTQKPSKLSNQIYREIQGKFINNLKDGLWSYKSKYEETTGSFVLGIPDGEWIRKEYDDKTKKFIVVEKMTYKDGKLIGDFYYKGEVGCHNGFNSSKAEVKGVFNNLGYLDGSWIVKWNYGEDIRKYKNGIMYFRLVRDIPTGYVAYITDSTNFVNEILNNLDKTTMYSIVNNIKYIVKDSFDKEFKSDAIYKYKRDYDKGDINYWKFVENDLLFCACDNWQGKFYGFKKGEKEINKNYKKIIINEELE